ncbi:hypothetical protein A2313_02875 [Candidatus Roizmanbacteria bacterium RIFOXYB2_FULL_41_10]|nr:MAG: hypothetical protein A2262_04040 [Candidatus Roizmanbacteria bacterium RIFOXYA2_FULL_41_8]OGK70678.1 MAG: hypothetical protein A2313_02875 [Candidatus Roizmanbacteria bacterium RIFOXYB2_FULL_41_10]OGK75560.1 MAG: hypothetical protein A2575_02560 [Candidatus Roizmanbacteria bacterium RIFOXYD1_FULL_41_24]
MASPKPFKEQFGGAVITGADVGVGGTGVAVAAGGGIVGVAAVVGVGVRVGVSVGVIEVVQSAAVSHIQRLPTAVLRQVHRSF